MKHNCEKDCIFEPNQLANLLQSCTLEKLCIGDDMFKSEQWRS